jgi:hypothetical protein
LVSCRANIAGKTKQSARPRGCDRSRGPAPAATLSETARFHR